MESMEANASNSANKQTTTPIGTCNSIEDFTKKGFAEIVEATKCANAFPQGAARDLYCAHSTFGRIVDERSDRILGLISHVLKKQNVRGNIQRRQPDEQFEMLLECNDGLFERLQTNLDELAGIKKAPQTVVLETRLHSGSVQGAGSWNLKHNSDASPALSARLITAKNIARPQVKFQIPVDNSAEAPFMPRLKEKPNSLKPLAILPEYDDAGNVVSYLHPYEFELLKFEVPKELLRSRNPEEPIDVESTPLEYVYTKAKLMQALDEMRSATELAVDVEHHSYRTFLGITCLVQISTRKKDYIFDALELRDEMHVLNEVFTDPRIVKIFHGADFDIEWLQRDLSIYVINMFDTHQAAKVLNFARLSLSYLLKHYCHKDVDKTFQLADWRIRPLPDELIAYARQDTHFLIYVYERITNDLLEAGHQTPQLLRTIYQRSTELCKKRYQKPLITPESHMDIYRKSKRTFDNRQLFALREIFKWRDMMARQEDESYGYVLPNHMMMQIAESLPREMQGILACCNPIPPLVRQNLHALHLIILKAREQPLVKPILAAVTVNRTASHSNAIDYNSKLHCPHDLTQAEEFRDDLPTLLNFKGSGESLVKTPSTVIPVKYAKPVLSFFDRQPTSEEDEKCLRYRRSERQKLLLPYQRYLAMLPMVEKEKREEAAREEAANKKRQLCPEPTPPSEMTDSKSSQEEPNTDEVYNLPIKALLKRKYDESVAKKAALAASSPGPSTSKRMKMKDENNEQPSNKKKLKQENRQINSLTESGNADDNGPPENRPIATKSSSDDRSQPEPNNAPTPNKKRQRPHPAHKSHQSSKPVQSNFDYHKVDFKKFKGGAQKTKGTELNSQYHAKSNANKTQNKKFNKLFTFSNVKSNKK